VGEKAAELPSSGAVSAAISSVKQQPDGRELQKNSHARPPSSFLPKEARGKQICRRQAREKKKGSERGWAPEEKGHRRNANFV